MGSTHATRCVRGVVDRARGFRSWRVVNMGPSRADVRSSVSSPGRDGTTLEAIVVCCEDSEIGHLRLVASAERVRTRFVRNEIEKPKAFIYT